MFRDKLTLMQMRRSGVSVNFLVGKKYCFIVFISTSLHVLDYFCKKNKYRALFELKAYIDVFTGEAWTAMLVYLFVLAGAMAAVAARGGGGGEAKEVFDDRGRNFPDVSDQMSAFYLQALFVRRRSGEEYYSSSAVDLVHRALTVLLPRYLALVWLSLLQRDTVCYLSSSHLIIVCLFACFNP